MARKKPESGKLLRVLGGDFFDNPLALSPDRRATVRCEIERGAGSEVVEAKFGKLQTWLQEAILAPYPLCACGRRRVGDIDRRDGYGRCVLCRNEETCDVCDDQRVRIAIIGDQRVCPVCVTRVQKDTQPGLPSEIVGSIRRQARELLACAYLTSEQGMVVLQAILRKSRLPAYASGWAHYYVREGVVWGSHLSPGALQILEHFPEAAGDPQRLMAAWVFDGPWRGGQDFFTQTQVMGRSRPVPPLPNPLHEPQLAAQLVNF